MRDWYQDFLTYRSNDYEDFEQYYSVPEDDDYEARDEGLTQAASLLLFGVAWNNVTPQIVAQTILNVQQRARAYRGQSKAWRKSAQGTQERNEIETQHRHVNVAIFFKVPRPNHKQFMHQSDMISQIIAEE